MKKLVLLFVIAALFAGGCVSTGETSQEERVLPDVDILGGYELSGEFHVYIAFGQSNMQGPGAIRSQDREGISERFRIMNVVAGRYAGGHREKHKLYRAAPPLIIPDGNLINYLGLSIGLTPIDYFGRVLSNNIPEDITIGVIAVANGDMALAAFHKTKAEDYYRGR
jgi:alpha-L-fucosidase 2